MEKNFFMGNSWENSFEGVANDPVAKETATRCEDQAITAIEWMKRYAFACLRESNTSFRLSMRRNTVLL